MLLDFDDFEEDVGFLMVLKKVLGFMILGHAAGF